jgi:hypothetical protein
MPNIGLSRLLQLVVLVPLLAMMAFGGVLVLETLNKYREVERLVRFERLVSAASQLTIKTLRIGGKPCRDDRGAAALGRFYPVVQGSC